MAALSAVPATTITDPQDRSPQDWFEHLNALFNTVTRRPWLDRAVRPLSEADPGSYFTRYTTPRDRYLDMLWSYNVGDPPLPQIEPEYRDAFRHVMRKARSNYAPMCIGAMADRMELQAVSTADNQDVTGDKLAAEIMDETGFAAVFKDLQVLTFSMGESYAMVVPPGPDAVELSNGKPCPTVHTIDPRRCVGIPDENNPTRLAAALVKRYDPLFGTETAYLFLPGRKWTFRYTGAGSNPWAFEDAEPETVTGLEALGGMPIVRFENPNGLGEYEPHIDLLDRINDTTLQRIIGFWYQALKQRAVFGDEEQEDEDDASEDTSSGIKAADLKAGPGALWLFPSDFKLWESSQADFSPFINAKRLDVQEFAAVTGTPLHLITPDAANGSAEGAGLMRESLTSKVRDRRTRFTPSLKLLWRIIFAMAGEAERGKRMRMHWGPIEFRTLAEQASASAQAQGTLSLQDRCERIWQMSPEEVSANVQRLTADQLVQAGAAGAAGPQQQPQPQQQGNDRTSVGAGNSGG